MTSILILRSSSPNSVSSLSPAMHAALARRQKRCSRSIKERPAGSVLITLADHRHLTSSFTEIVELQTVVGARSWREKTYQDRLLRWEMTVRPRLVHPEVPGLHRAGAPNARDFLFSRATCAMERRPRLAS